MQFSRIFIIFIFSYFIQSNVNAASSLKVLSETSSQDSTHKYFFDLIMMLIQKSSDKYPPLNIDVVDINESKTGLSIAALKYDMTDIYWGGTSIEREQQFIPVRIPLMFGLLGHRVSIIHKDNHRVFQKLVNNTEKIKQLTACQGSTWPDSDILEKNGYKVARTFRFEQMFKMIHHKRCDYFPRAIYEAQSEVEVANINYPELVIFDDIILHYPYPFYFFFNKSKANFADRFKYALNKSVADGSLLKFMKTHDITKHVFPLNKWQNKKIIKLRNNFLPEHTPVENKTLWLSIQNEKQ